MGMRPGSHIRNPRRDKVSTSVSSWLNFTPASLNPQLWLDASDSSTVTLSGSAVTQWNDKSGNGYNLAQGTASNQPSIITAAQNGLDVIDFDGSNDRLVLTASSILGQNVSSLMMYAVRSSDIVTAVSRTIVSFSTATNTVNRAFLGSGISANKLAVGGRRLDADSLVTLSDSADMIANTYQIQTGLFIYDQTLLQLYVDSAQVAENTSFQTSGSTSNTASARIAVGANPILASPWDGKIGEILIFNSFHTAGQRQAVWQYLAKKWGLTI